jgi:hypothetical protein
MLAQARFSDRLFSSRSVEGIMTPLLYRPELHRASMDEAYGALRSYLVYHAHAERCGESASRTTEEERIRVAFNSHVEPKPLIPPKNEESTPEDLERSKAANVARVIALIAADEIRSESFGTKAKVASYANTDDAKIREMKSDYSRIRYADDDQRGTPQWNDDALQFLNKLERWSKELGQSNRELFFQKAQWYGALVYATPEGKLRELFLDSYVKFLAGSPVERESPPEWAMWVNRLIGAADIADRDAWLDHIRAAGDSAVAAYCELAKLQLTLAK